MAFGQPSGPSASFRQVETLLTLVHEAGHADFRDARGPLGLTQRQAAGRFTRDEVTALIDRLEGERDSRDGEGAPPVAPVVGGRMSAAERSIRRMPDHLLAVELQRRGWTVTGP